jgi:hypothetical protein
MLDLGDFMQPPPVNDYGAGNIDDSLRFNLLGPVYQRAAPAEHADLNLRTFRAFQNQEGIIDAWNSDMAQLMTRSDREKRGELKIGVELPSVVESVLGEGGAGLKVSGRRRITFAGRSQWDDASNVSERRQSKFPSLTMDQISSFTVEGTVGSKVFVRVDQDSRRTTDLENRIQIRYKGDEDDILQSVEAGNTNLSLPNTRFVGYSQRIQGLFGFKSTAQLGPIDFTMIASQEKGNTERSRFTAGAKENTIVIRDYEYARYRMFDIGPLTNPTTHDTINLIPDDAQIVAFSLFESTGTTGTNRRGSAFEYWPDTSNIDFSTNPIVSQYVELDNSVDYIFDSGRRRLTFPRRRSGIENRTLAYYLKYQTSDGSIVEIGQLGDYLKLQLLKTRSPSPNDPFWIAEWKNIYDLGTRDIDYQDLDLRIYKGAAGTEQNPSVQNLDHQDGVPYLEIFGLDSRNASGTVGSPDGKIDENYEFLDLVGGLLYFPDRRPFDTDNKYAVGANADVTLAERVPIIYNSTDEIDKRNKSRYYIKLTTRSRSTSFTLGRVNIMPESETVTLGGRRLNRGTDYTIDYDIGKIDFRTDAVLDPNADLTIDYEYAPFLTVEKKTLFGLRSEYAPSQQFHTGATMLYKGSKASDRPAQLGSEPFRDLVLDYDLFWRTDAGVLTSMVDALPLVETDAKSNFTIEGEIARSMSNPNTRGEVFIDDFEGTQLRTSLGILRTVWTIASPPVDMTLPDHHRPLRGFQDPALIWYNPYRQFRITNIFDREFEQEKDNRQHVLVLRYDPAKSPLHADTTFKGTNRDVWGGIMRGLPQTLWNQARAELIELRMAVVSDGTEADNGILHIDLGKISEDIDDLDFYNTEDSLNTGIRDGILTVGEDIGLDGIPDGEEPAGAPDDNWGYETNNECDFSHLNGTEGNRTDLQGRPDTEDIGGESELDLDNDYYSYQIDLSQLQDYYVENTEKTVNISGLAIEDRMCEEQGSITWHTFRIPLWTTPEVTKVGDPDSSKIYFARLWLDNANAPMRIYIAQMELVENRWQGDLLLADSVSDVNVGDIGTYADPSSKAPEGVVVPADAVRDLPPEFRVAVKSDEVDNDYREALKQIGLQGYTDPHTQVTEREQALSLEFENFLPNDTGKAEFPIPQTQDYTGYRYLRMLVHADPGEDGRTQFYFRMGQGPDLYYEYRLTSLTPNSWHYVAIDLDALTVFKERSRVAFGEAVIDTFDARSGFGVKGLPSLSRVSYLEMGVFRSDAPPSARPAHSGEVWVDELRLTDVKREPGMAGRMSVTAQFADFAGVTASVLGRGYAFRELTAGRTGSLVNAASTLDQQYRFNISLHKFFPEGLGLSLPISVSYAKNTQRPKLLTGSDVVLTEDLRDRETSESVTEGYTLSGLRLSPPEAGWLIRSTIGGLSGGFSTRRSVRTSPTIPYDTSISYTANASYSVNFSKRLTFPPLYFTKFLLLPRRLSGTRLSLLPKTFQASGNVSRIRQHSLNSSGIAQELYTRTFNGRAQTSLSPIPSVSMRYGMNTQRDISARTDDEIVNLSLDPKEFKLGKETQFTEDFTGDYKPSLLPFFSPAFSYRIKFSDRIDPTYRDHDISRDITKSFGSTIDPDDIWAFLAGKGSRRRGRTPRQRYNPRERRLQNANKTTDKDSDSDSGRGSDSDSDSVSTGTKKESGGGPGVMDLWRGFISGLSLLTSPIEPVTVNYSQGNRSQLANQDDRPTFAYRFGFSDNSYTVFRPGPRAQTQVDATTTDNTLRIRNNLKFLRFLTLNSEFGHTESKRVQYDQSLTSENSSEATTFPSLSTSFNQVEKIIPFRWIFANATASIAYSQSENKSWTGERDSLNTPTSESTNKGFSPLLKLSGTTKKGVRLNFEISNTENEAFRATGTQSRTESNAWTLSGDYSFRSPNGIPLPFLRSLRFNSQLSLSVTIRHTASKEYTKSEKTDSWGSPNRARSEMSISPRANYSFSSRVNGGMTAEWRDTKDNSTGTERNSHSRELAFWVEFTF